MRQVTVSYKGKIKKNTSYEGECIEQQLRRKMAGEEIDIKAKSLMYTEDGKGVNPMTDIRTDKWAVAQEAKTVQLKFDTAKSAAIAKGREEKGKEGSGKTASTDGSGD